MRPKVVRSLCNAPSGNEVRGPCEVSKEAEEGRGSVVAPGREPDSCAMSRLLPEEASRVVEPRPFGIVAVAG